MKTRLLIAGLLVALVGCQSSPPPTAEKLETKPEEAFPVLDLASIQRNNSIGLFREKSGIRVGDSVKEAFQVFPEPSRGSYALRELPLTFKKPYEVRGWETSKGEGFGLIALDATVVLAMYQLANTDEATLNDLLRLQNVGTGTYVPAKLLGRRVRYWIWEQSGQTLVVSALKTAKGVSLTLAVGADQPMDALGFSSARIRADFYRIEDKTAEEKSADQTAKPNV